MLAYTIKRLLISIPLVLGIVTITFVMIRVAPGDPLDMYLEPQRQRQVDPEIVELLRQKYGLDQPIHIQYIRWISAVAKGDFGESFRSRRPVGRMLAEAIPYTLQLTILATLFDALLGIMLGIIAAVKQYTALDKAVTMGSLIVYAIPGFWLALMMVMVFSVHLGWFPTSQTRSMDYEFLSFWGKLGDRAWHLVLPVFVLGIGSAAGTARYVRNRLLDVLNADFVWAARARGFSWPGMGNMAVGGVGGRDYPVIMATTLIAAVLTVLGNLLADITYAVVDPRVTYGGRRKHA